MPYISDDAKRLMRENFAAMVEPAFKRAYDNPETIKLFKDLFSEDETSRKIAEAYVAGMWQTDERQDPLP